MGHSRGLTEDGGINNSEVVRNGDRLNFCRQFVVHEHCVIFTEQQCRHRAQWCYAPTGAHRVGVLSAGMQSYSLLSDEYQSQMNHIARGRNTKMCPYKRRRSIITSNERRSPHQRSLLFLNCTDVRRQFHFTIQYGRGYFFFLYREPKNLRILSRV